LIDYEFELRREGAVIATGRIQLDETPRAGDTLPLGKESVTVVDVLDLGRRRRLILEAI
jgi:hypothetical protein